MKEITTDEIVRILCGDISTLDEMLEDVEVKNNTSEDDNDDSSGTL
jgi:hypothetical protein